MPRTTPGAQTPPVFHRDDQWEGGGWVELAPSHGMARHKVALGVILEQAGVPAELIEQVAQSVRHAGGFPQRLPRIRTGDRIHEVTPTGLKPVTGEL